MALSAIATSLPLSSNVRLRAVSAGRRRKSWAGVLSTAEDHQHPILSHVSAAVVLPSILLRGRNRSAAPTGRLQQRTRRGSLLVFAVEDENSKSNSEAETSEASIEALETRLGVGRRARRQAGSDESKSRPESVKPKAKKWESMTLTEKFWSLYIDPEKGILFWLNKLAYGAIFAIIGGWIVFRFIGPALGLYELDQPLLTPDRLLDDGL